MRSVAPGDQISREHCSAAQRCLNRIVVLFETLDAGAEAVLDLILGRLVPRKISSFDTRPLPLKAVTGISVRRLPSALIHATPR
jgi:hypothetical protein